MLIPPQNMCFVFFWLDYDDESMMPVPSHIKSSMHRFCWVPSRQTTAVAHAAAPQGESNPDRLRDVTPPTAQKEKIQKTLPNKTIFYQYHIIPYPICSMY